MKLQTMNIVGFLMVLAVAGCNVAPKAKPASEAPMPTTQAATTLQPGDNVELKFFYAPELNDTQRVLPDGTLTLQLVGSVKVVGKTSAEVSDLLKTAYSEHIKYPSVQVILRDQLQQKVYVAGEVIQPGIVDLYGHLTVLDAVMNRGGFDMTTAEISTVVVMRHENGKRVGYKVDLRDAIAGGETASFYLQPQDIVFVPRTAVVNINNFLEQYVAGLIPQTGFVYTRNSGNATYGVDTRR